MVAIEIVEAFGDNYIYLVEYEPGLSFAVDPGDAGPVEAVLSQRNVKLTHILETHHHQDHIGGIAALKSQYGGEVLGPDSRRIPGIDRVIEDGGELALEPLSIRCIATPGHTTTSVCYYMTGEKLASPALFSGDTLFAYGCGRLFECDARTMHASLQTLAALPDETLVYPGHNYTEENLRFALTIEPEDQALREKCDEIHCQSQLGHATIPSTLAEEKLLNPFFKAQTWQQFADLRKKKDIF